MEITRSSKSIKNIGNDLRFKSFLRIHLQSNLETKEKITRKALQIFKKLGIKSVSMDDLARELGMSKKTIYQHFKDKRELVSESMEYEMDMDREACLKVFEQNDNAVQQMINISSYVQSNLEGINPAVLYDIEKYYPNCWTKFKEYSESFVLKSVKFNLEKGIAEGDYRSDIDIHKVASIYVYLVDSFTNSEFLARTGGNVTEIQQHIIQYHLHAICTEKGLTYYKQHIKL